MPRVLCPVQRRHFRLIAALALGLSAGCDLVDLHGEAGEVYNCGVTYQEQVARREPRSIEEGLKHPYCVESLDLGLDSDTMTVLPPGVLQFPNLWHLLVGGTRLRALPGELDRLPLKVVALPFNDFADFPRVLLRLPQLDNLALPFNRLDSIPWRIDTMSRLSSLDLQHNKLREVPAALFRMPSLERLKVQYNSIDSLPWNIDIPARLQGFEAQRNNLREVPVALFRSPSLLYLNLDSNRITRLPDSLRGATGLIHLHLAGNPLAPGEQERIRQQLPWVKVFF
jgi:leucine-rich repeat protein SHOC2